MLGKYRSDGAFRSVGVKYIEKSKGSFVSREKIIVI